MQKRTNNNRDESFLVIRERREHCPNVRKTENKCKSKFQHIHDNKNNRQKITPEFAEFSPLSAITSPFWINLSWEIDWWVRLVVFYLLLNFHTAGQSNFWE